MNPDSQPRKFDIVAGQFIRFGLVGAVGVSINFAVLNFLSYLFQITKGEGIILISAVAFSAAVTNSYVWNKAWTFNDHLSDHGRKFTMFLLISLIGVTINSLIVFLITTYVNQPAGLSPRLWLNFANVLAVGASGLWNFTGYKIIVFKK